MALSAGTRLGIHDILGLLGSGGNPSRPSTSLRAVSLSNGARQQAATKRWLADRGFGDAFGSGGNPSRARQQAATKRWLADRGFGDAFGSGGRGEVYHARDTKLEREVAIKVLPEIFARDPVRLARFDREARLLASLNHPNIAAIYGVAESDGVHCLVLELVLGETLRERVARAGPLPAEEALV